ncbi:hypothetical protein VMCG_07668 [Cytospora schulzeri]|uniref:C2H2-type domain-containing protein n=1 Tax=Cytospora schulzeri TaxID=448051 RepID=A0A423VZ42_9PEZI|nr:hypothetical protein VMCG_07668 [Valsa malicola]
MGNRLDLKIMGKSLKKCIDEIFDFSSPDESTTQSLRSSMSDNSDESMSGEPSEKLEGAPSTPTPGFSELQAHPPLQDGNFLVDFHGQNGSLPDCLLSQNLKVAIPRINATCLGYYPQTSPNGSFATSDSTLASSVYSANSEQTSLSSFGGSTFCESMSPSSGYNFSPDAVLSPTYERSQITPMPEYPQLPNEFSSSYTNFSQGDAVAYVTRQANCNMIGFSGGMETYSPTYSPSYSPSSNAPIGGREPFEGPVPSYSPDVPHFVSRDCLVNPTFQESRHAVEVAGSQPTDNSSSFNSVKNWPANNVTGISGTDSSPTGHDSQSYQCNDCPWKPEEKGRTAQRLRQALRKHIKRNHQTEDFQCSICPTIIQKRADNMKDHVRRKHPEQFPHMYPGSDSKRRQSEVSSSETPKKRVRSTQGYISPAYSPQGLQGPPGLTGELLGGR